MSPQGRWNVVIDTPMGRKSGVLELLVDGQRLSGSLTHGEHATPILDGRMEGNELRWSAHITKPMRMNVKFVATVEDDRIRGTVRYLLGRAEFSGVRA
jgi:hypothetical protein